MKLSTLLESQFDWEGLMNITKGEIESILQKQNLSFGGGYCFHLALALFLKAKKLNVEVDIIGDNGHVAIYSFDAHISVDYKGVHPGEGALNERRVKTFTTAKGLINAVKRGHSSQEQNEDLEKVYQAFK